MKKVLLFVAERSSKIAKQYDDLKRIYGENVEITVAPMANYAGWEDIVKVSTDYDILVGDFSMEVLTNLINPEKNTKPVIRIKWQRIYGGFNYLGLEKVKMVFEEL